MNYKRYIITFCLISLLSVMACITYAETILYSTNQTTQTITYPPPSGTIATTSTLEPLTEPKLITTITEPNRIATTTTTTSASTATTITTTTATIATTTFNYDLYYAEYLKARFPNGTTTISITATTSTTTATIIYPKPILEPRLATTTQLTSTTTRYIQEPVKIPIPLPVLPRFELTTQNVMVASPKPQPTPTPMPRSEVVYAPVTEDQAVQTIKDISTFFKTDIEVTQPTSRFNSDSPEVLQVYLDSDKDNVSDFDERFVFHTDPNKPSTTGGLSDGDKILQGINPLSIESSTTTQKIQYEEPVIATNILPQSLKVTKIEVAEKEVIEDTEKVKKINFAGKAFPNSFVTLYIYSTPVIVTIKTNADGEWTYSLEKELEDGNHSMYVAMVNNSGKVLARSEAIPFVKEASAINFEQSNVTASPQEGFFKKYFIWISLLVLVLAVVATLGIAGMRSNNPNV
jgi:hypothetical protein